MKPAIVGLCFAIGKVIGGFVNAYLNRLAPVADSLRKSQFQISFPFFIKVLFVATNCLFQILIQLRTWLDSREERTNSFE